MKIKLGKNGKKGLRNEGKTDLKGVNFTGNIDKIFDIPLFSKEERQVLKILGKNLDLGTKKYWVATVNPEFVMMAQKDEKFKRLLFKTNLNVIDGIGLVWAHQLDDRYKVLDARKKNKISKFLLGFKIGVEVLRGKYKDQVASGADLILKLSKMVKEKNKKIFLLGGWDNRAEKTVNFLKSGFGFSDKQITWCKGEPGVSKKEVIKAVNDFKPDVLLVAYGMRKQEFWINDNLSKLDVGIVIGVGRSFDYYSGELKRAPGWLRKMGLEWFYSLMMEPSRFKRQLVLPKFVWKVLTD